jgi:phosphohistidine phosphatase
MLLYLLRHGIAEDHGSRASDDERELTTEGREKTRDVMNAARKMKLFSPTLVISSPLIRAKQTAEIAMESFAKDAKYEMDDSLKSGANVIDTMALVVKWKSYEHIMLVGHEPHMSQFGSALLGSATPIIEMKKAALAKFEILRMDAVRMRGVLLALLPPKIGSI